MGELLDENLGVERPDTADARRQVAGARPQAQRLSALAAGLLDLSRLDTDVPLRDEPVEPGELRRAVAAEFRTRPRAGCDSSSPCPARRPGARATRGPSRGSCASDRERAALRAAGTAVGVAVASGPGGPSIAVAEAGPGVAVEDRELIFGRFARGHAEDASPGSRARPDDRPRAGRADGRLRCASSPRRGAPAWRSRSARADSP